MGYVAIGTQLKTILDSVEGIEQVYDHDPDGLAKYPAATVQALSHTNSFADTAANIRRYSFLIRLFYRLDDDQDAELILRNLADLTLQALEENVTVSGVWDILRPTGATWTHVQRELPVRVCEITVEIESRELRAGV